MGGGDIMKKLFFNLKGFDLLDVAGIALFVYLYKSGKIKSLKRN